MDYYASSIKLAFLDSLFYNSSYRSSLYFIIVLFGTIILLFFNFTEVFEWNYFYIICISWKLTYLYCFTILFYL